LALILAESHFFWQAVRDPRLAFAGVSTHEQRADVMTKGLVRAAFEKLRKKIMGWQAIPKPSLRIRMFLRSARLKDG
jgi:hypothetical protein